MASSGTIYANDHYVGSAAEAIVRKSNRPVVLVGPSCDIDAPFNPSKIVVGLDGSARAEAAVPIGLDWAQQLDLPAELLMVVDEGTTAALAAWPAGSPEVESGNPMTGYLDHMCRSHCTEDVAVAGNVLHAQDPASGILKGGDGGLIVLSTHGWSGLARIAIGSVTAEVCSQAKAPVVVVRPDLSDNPSAGSGSKKEDSAQKEDLRK